MEKDKHWFLKRILTVEEACKYCNISLSKLYKHTMNKTITYYKPEGRKIYFLREDLDKWLLRNRSVDINEVEREANKISMAR